VDLKGKKKNQLIGMYGVEAILLLAEKHKLWAEVGAAGVWSPSQA
jgi:hypothetical protein